MAELVLNKETLGANQIKKLFELYATGHHLGRVTPSRTDEASLVCFIVPAATFSTVVKENANDFLKHWITVKGCSTQCQLPLRPWWTSSKGRL